MEWLTRTRCNSRRVGWNGRPARSTQRAPFPPPPASAFGSPFPTQKCMTGSRRFRVSMNSEPESPNEESNRRPRRRLCGIEAGEFETSLLAELRLGIPPTFYFQLSEIKDDWAFVLKIHSFFEGALTQLLREKLRLRPHVREGLTPGDSFPTRVHLASRMKLMEPDYHGFLLGLNRLRNDITHNIRFIAFDFRSYVDSLSDSEFRRGAFNLCAGFKNVPSDAFPKLEPPKNARPRDCRTVREVFWHLSPKLSIWNAGLEHVEKVSISE